MTNVSGNTYPVRDQIRALGGKWNANAKAWQVPDERAEEAKALVASAPKSELSRADIIAIAVRKRGGKPGVCYACGSKCKYPYDLCWDCKELERMGDL